jgi:cell division septal protein FtsQ
MHQLINNKKIKIFLIFFFFILLSSYNKDIKNSNKFFYIKTIEFENNYFVSDELLNQYFNFLNNKNIFILDQNELNETYKKLPLIQNIIVKKIYPNKIKIIITEKKPVAVMQSTVLLEDWSEINSNLITHIEGEELPLINIFNPEFIEVYKSFIKYNLQNKKVSEFYANKIGRWDIIFSDKKELKLPEKNFSSALKNFFEIEQKQEFKEFKIFDYRIEDKLILE